MSRPLVYVLAGVNGAGKSSLGGRALAQSGLTWFNPDAYARDWSVLSGCPLAEANGIAWQEGVRRLDKAIVQGRDHAFARIGGENYDASDAKLSNGRTLAFFKQHLEA